MTTRTCTVENPCPRHYAFMEYEGDCGKLRGADVLEMDQRAKAIDPSVGCGIFAAMDLARFVMILSRIALPVMPVDGEVRLTVSIPRAGLRGSTSEIAATIARLALPQLVEIAKREGDPPSDLDAAIAEAEAADVKVIEARRARVMALLGPVEGWNAYDRAYHEAKDTARAAWQRATKTAVTRLATDPTAEEARKP